MSIATEELKLLAFVTVKDLVADFLYYDRKQDEKLSLEALSALIESNDLTVDEVIKWFSHELKLQWREGL